MAIQTSSNESPPDASVLTKAAGMEVLDGDNNAIKFGSILDSQDSRIKRVMVVFIRHFHCGLCQQYIQGLSAQIQPSSSDSYNVVVIGCGAASHIKPYKRDHNCRFDLYTDQSTQIYQLFGTHRTLNLGPKPDYAVKNLFTSSLKSVGEVLRKVPAGNVFNGGDFNLNGGEFLFVRKSSTTENGTAMADSSGTKERNSNLDEWEVTWCHRMQSTRDHTEIYDLQTILGLTPTMPKPKRRPSEMAGQSCSTNGQCDAPVRPVNTVEAAAAR